MEQVTLSSARASANPPPLEPCTEPAPLRSGHIARAPKQARFGPVGGLGVKPIDIGRVLPDAIESIRERGEAPSPSAVLEALGVSAVPSLPDGASKPSGPGDLPPEDEPLSLGRFQLRGELGRGGMGRVLEAKDPELRRTVAVKVIVDPSKVTSAQLARFVAEAQITSQLEHPNIVPVHDMGISDDGQIYFVMKKVEGSSLREVLAALRRNDVAAHAAWGRRRLLNVFVQVCNAVAYAHDRRVLHRDLKPDNIMLGPFGEVLLMDWGVARLIGDVTEAVEALPLEPDVPPEVRSESVERVTLTRTLDGAAIGTPGYMAPEQVRGQLHTLDERADVWSLGAILYELLCGVRAYEAHNPFALMFQSISGPPVDPRERSPERAVPDEIAEVAMKALTADPEARYATASELSAAVEAFLEGSQRRAAALRHVDEAHAAWGRYASLAGERVELLAREKRLEVALEPWAPLAAKAELHEVRRRLSGLGRARVDRFEEVVFACDQALTQAPNNPEARAFLAAAHYARFEEAETARNEDEQYHHSRRVLRYDDRARYAPLLKGTGALTLRTEPAGAEVLCERYDRAAATVWPLVERRRLGVTPLEEVPLPQGSYLLTIRSPGKRDTRCPVFIQRGRHWRSGPEPVPLLTDGEIGSGFVYVAAGPFVWGGDEYAGDSPPRSEPQLGGFLLSVLPVTHQDYCDFINDLAREEPELAWARVPRSESGPDLSGGQFWERPDASGAYVVPAVDRHGDAWHPDWPANGVSWLDAVAYARWRTARDGRIYRLPTEMEWEKAARGVDGRIFPWGDGFDPTLCRMRLSRPGRPQAEPVGAYETDCSPYGVRDLAGGMRDFCGDEAYGADRNRRPVRGGSWYSLAGSCRTTHRGGREPWSVNTVHGFRLARPL